MSFQDKTLTCRDCGREFIWTAGEQEFYAGRGAEPEAGTRTVRDEQMSSRLSASVTVKLRGGPFDGKSAVAYGAFVGGLIDVNHRKYRVTKVETIPGWTELVAWATYEEAPKPKPRLNDHPARP